MAAAESDPVDPFERQDAKKSSDFVGYPSHLHAAVNLADVIRSSIFQQGRQHGSQDRPSGAHLASTNPPGLVDGLIAGCLVLAFLTPVRSRVLQSIGSSKFGIFPDLVVSSTQVALSATAALYMGSLQGSRAYLQQLANANPSRQGPDEWALQVCNSSLVNQLLKAPMPGASEIRQEFYFTQDPRRRTVESLAAALDNCRSLQNHNNGEEYYG
jgi:hypothetical protein